MQGDEVVEELGSILAELQDKLPLLEQVANAALRPRHWIEILELVDALQQFCPEEAQRRGKGARGPPPMVRMHVLFPPERSCQFVCIVSSVHQFGDPPSTS